MTRQTKLGFAVLVLAFASLALIALLRQSALPVVILPNPNGYDDFVQAAEIVTVTPDYRTQEVTQLRISVGQNANALALARTALTKQCRVPIEYNEAYATKLLPRLASFKQLALAFVVEGKLAENENRLGDAAQSYVDCLKFGEESARDGLLIEKLVGLACESLALQGLRRLPGELSVTDAQKLLDALTKIQSHQEPLNDWMKPEKIWSRYSFENWRATVTRWVTRKATRESERRSLQKRSRSQAELRLLRVDLALKLYHSEKGVYANRLQELGPRYLDSIPIDPFSDKPLVYHAQTNSYLLYSVGPDRVDDGGKPLVPPKTSGDIPKGDIVLNPQPQN